MQNGIFRFPKRSGSMSVIELSNDDDADTRRDRYQRRTLSEIIETDTGDTNLLPSLEQRVKSM